MLHGYLSCRIVPSGPGVSAPFSRSILSKHREATRVGGNGASPPMCALNSSTAGAEGKRAGSLTRCLRAMRVWVLPPP